MGEHLLCKQGVVGSIPISSTTCLRSGQGAGRELKRVREERERAEASRGAAYLWLFSRVISVVL